MLDILIDNREVTATTIAIVGLLILILRYRMSAFPALLLVSLLAALGAGMSVDEALSTVQKGMGGTLGFIAVVVGLGSMFGILLQTGGGIEALAEWFLGKTSADKSKWLIGFLGLVVAIPVFFDVALIILAPVVFAIAHRAGKPVMSLALPMLAGLATAHAFIPPTPGPMAVAELLSADIGMVILFGVIVGVPAMLVAGPIFVSFATRHNWLPVSSGEEISHMASDIKTDKVGRTIAVVLVPLVLILLGSVVKAFSLQSSLADLILFIGHPFVALLLACGLAYFLYKPDGEEEKTTFRRAMERSLEPAGVVILITGAGGAFKQVLVDTGAGAILAENAVSIGLTPLVAGFVIALLVRVAQGSATVAMITAAGLTAPIVESLTLSSEMTALVVVSIASGATAFSHVNDSGFWLVSKYFHLSPKQTLRTWTVSSGLVGFTGFGMALLVSMFVV